MLQKIDDGKGRNQFSEDSTGTDTTRTAAALASYAKQADDETLMNMALRIKSRAIQRTGELLKQIEAVNVARDRKDGADLPVGRTQAAREAGLSERQQKQATRVANVPMQVMKPLAVSGFSEFAQNGANRSAKRCDKMCILESFIFFEKSAFSGNEKRTCNFNWLAFLVRANLAS